MCKSYTLNDPYEEFGPCETPQDEKLGFYSFAATMLALPEAKWTIDAVNKDTGEILATACRNNRCTSLIFHSFENGTVIEHNRKNERLIWRPDNEIREFRRQYAIYRCYTRETLQKEMNKYGYQFNLPKTEATVENDTQLRSDTTGQQRDGGIDTF